MTFDHRTRQEQPVRPTSTKAPSTGCTMSARPAPVFTQAELRQIVLDIIG